MREISNVTKDDLVYALTICAVNGVRVNFRKYNDGGYSNYRTSLCGRNYKKWGITLYPEMSTGEMYNELKTGLNDCGICLNETLLKELEIGYSNKVINFKIIYGES